jgi:hypothetical protein
MFLLNEYVSTVQHRFGEARRQAGETRPVLLAPVGRWSSDAGVFAVIPRRIRALPLQVGQELAACRGEGVARGKRRAGSGPGKGASPDFHGAGKTFRLCAAKFTGSNRGYCHIVFGNSERKMEIPVRF